MTKTWIVKGCNVSIVCTSTESVHQWVVYIIQKGGTPEVEELEEAI
jgi:hypothetical protein